MKTHLLELQLKRTELLTRFEPSYRLVQEVDRQIDETRQSIAAEALTPVRDETTDKDPNYEWARMELEKAEVQGQSLRARQATAAAQIANLRTSAQQMQVGFGRAAGSDPYRQGRRGQLLVCIGASGRRRGLETRSTNGAS